jgi:hypothetical protein
VASTWTIILRRHSCGKRFALQKIPLERISLIPQVSPCPHCAAKSVIAAGPEDEAKSKLHRIIDLREEGVRKSN